MLRRNKSKEMREKESYSMCGPDKISSRHLNHNFNIINIQQLFLLLLYMVYYQTICYCNHIYYILKINIYNFLYTIIVANIYTLK